MRFKLQGDWAFGFQMWDSGLSKLVGDGKGGVWETFNSDEAEVARDEMNRRVGA